MTQKCILLVEDDDQFARAMTHLLKLHGVKVLRAATMVSAVHLIRENTEICAVLTDWQFPFRDDEFPRDAAGERVYREAKERDLPVAVMSGREGGAVAGFTPWFEKPVDKKVLDIWVQGVLTG
jgi:CheY-like chemotaxis protein